MDKGTRRGKGLPQNVIPIEKKAEHGFLLGSDPLARRLREEVRGFIEKLVIEELEEVLQARRYQRLVDEGEAEGRQGYRHGARERELTTSVGTATIRVPRARLFMEDGEGTKEWRSELLPRYGRRSRAVDETLLMAYLSGANTRRIKGALRPLLFEGAPLSRSAISRVVRELKESFDAWRTQRLEEKEIVFLFLDAIVLKVRVDGRVESMCLLVALGVDASGEKELLGLTMVAREATTAWATMVADLEARGLRPPLLCITDGNPGLHAAIKAHWKEAKIQRCVVHKLRNLEAHCPKRALDDLRRDYHAITEAESEKLAIKAHSTFLKVWSARCEGVAKSLREAGDELLTHYRFPKSQWKCIRTTNAIERLNEEFRRRVKTQGSLPNEGSVLHLLYGIYASGQIRMRRIDGWQDLARLVSRHHSPRKAQVA